ncbi:hypothetical protein [Rhizobium sp. S163]|uniref:hypothetical protein n=1 Tax=Rhizobium sp. S163 TaxID=3055039 RepID=UPI0025A96049|nr:hypothetical protein [Rhizobium sp. S163]MDM9649107.1 hypothetical protein [Rhizobium sp. S163]
MHLLETRVAHDRSGWRVDFLGDDEEAVSIKVADGHATSEEEAVKAAREVMIQLTAFGTRGGGRSVNAYDSASNGNFDDQWLLDTWH